MTVKRQSAGQEVAQTTSSAQTSSDKAKPAHEERLGRVKAVIWGNQTSEGVRYHTQFKRLFKRDGSGKWETSDSFGREDLPLLIEVARRSWLWAYAQGAG